MIDFTELPPDGRLFEQFVRELCLVLSLRPQWSGAGQDQGRDLLITDRLHGYVDNVEQRWLVQCKHSAHASKAIGRQRLGDFVGDCQQADAHGYLLVTSTYVSSGLFDKLKGIAKKARLRFAVWDGVHLERLLTEPRMFSLGHLFFPKSFSNTPWKLYNGGEPNEWTAHYRQYFLHLSSRISSQYPNLSMCAKIIDSTQELSVGDTEYVRPRAIFYDDKNHEFRVFLDYLVPHRQTPSLEPADMWHALSDLEKTKRLFDIGCRAVNWDVILRKTIPRSDRFDLDHRRYYDRFSDCFRDGVPRGRDLEALFVSGEWPDAS